MSSPHEATTPRQQGAVPDADQAWVAVLRRDRSYDGAFVYAVKTTGVYCRPSCPSRRPRRENVAFYSDGAAAHQHGFRACRRCRPDDDATSAQVMVANARAYLEQHVDEPVTLDQVARAAGVSPFHLQRTFTRELGVSPKRYHTALRAARFRSALRRGAPVLDAAFEAGFGASSRAYETAPGYFGMTPALYRRGAPGVAIRFTTRDTAFGVLLVAATERGVCAVFLGEGKGDVQQMLADEYPKAERSQVGSAPGSDLDAQVEQWADDIARSMDAPGAAADVPIDVAGTPFQQRVWQTLRRIPAGETRSYAAVAQAVGSPGAVRAVANACAHNRVAVLVPCHRVVRENGEIGGYRWGHARKRRLLEAEARTDVRSGS
jgi:AraC family transcriptional regulator of adaptative response/methylated-DNA-[protein]-cysteine methyltransferase